MPTPLDRSFPAVPSSADGGETGAPAAPPSFWRAWWYLIGLSLWRQARARQMVWIALWLLGFTAAFVAVLTAAGRWEAANRPWPTRESPPARVWLEQVQAALWAVPGVGSLGTPAVVGAVQAAAENTEFSLFSRSVVLSFFLSFLLPIWSLSFATEALGGEREGNSLIWLLTRPLPRPAIYLAKFVALLPWSLGLNLGGFALLCLLAGPGGWLALERFWPAVLWATLAFAALFHLMGACFRRAAVVAIVYSFFLETILGNMPGYLKRVSIGFYTRCMMYEAAADLDLQPRAPQVFLAVDGGTALVVLVLLTAGLLALGAYLFARREYRETV